MTEQIQNYRGWRVWRMAMDLVTETYRVTAAFPKPETYGLASQVQRCAISIPSNIAEGHQRESTREYLHHISIAQGSLAELETQAEIAVRLAYCSSEVGTQLLANCAAVAKPLYALRNALQKKIDP